MSLIDVMTDLAACLCAELTPEGETDPGFCFCGVLPGQQVGLVGECKKYCGQAWVRLEGAYPAVAPGVEPQPGQLGCGAFLGADLEIGVFRCFEIDDEDPSAEYLAETTAQQILDMEAMRRAVMCCAALEDVDYALGTYTPYGPLGMRYGGMWTLSVSI